MLQHSIGSKLAIHYNYKDIHIGCANFGIEMTDKAQSGNDDSTLLANASSNCLDNTISEERVNG